jgi:peptide/nickel transport system substrate-binding protein
VSGSNISTFATNERFTLYSYELPQYTAVFLNMDSGILKNEKVRLALQKALDKKKLLDQFNDKIQVDTPLMELNQQDWEYKPNLDEANGSLKDAGYAYNEDDVAHTGSRFDKKGNALELNLIAMAYNEGTDKFDESKKVLNFLIEAWKSVGVSVKLELLSPGDFEQRVSSRQYDMVFLGQSMGYNLDTYSYWHSSQASDGLNLSNYKSFQVDTLIEDVRNTFDPAKREDRLKELADKIKTDIPAIFLYRPVYYYASDGKVSGINMDGVAFPSDRYARIANWKFER